MSCPTTIASRYACLAPALLALGGCAAAAVQVTTTRSIARASDLVWVDVDVPAVRGAPGCGSQALASLVALHDRERQAADVAEALPWHEIEAGTDELIETARANGLDAALMPASTGAIIDELRYGRPVLIRLDERGLPDRRAPDTQTPTLRGWAIVSGWREDDGSFLLPRAGGRVLRLLPTEFERRWRAEGRVALQVAAGRPP